MRAPISVYNGDILLARLGMIDVRHKCSKPVRVDRAIYPSIKAASMAIGCCRQSLMQAISEKRKCNGHSVEYVSQGE